MKNLNFISDEILSNHLQNRIKKTVKKGTILQRKGDSKMKAFLVTKGLLRSYFIDEKGNEHVFMFAPENWLITDVNLISNNNESEAVLYIDALENSEIEIIDEFILQHISQLPNNILFDQIIKLINRLNSLQNRVLLLLSATAKERYKDFVNTYPQILQRVPQKMIASYLGIAPQTLSVLRRSKSNIL